MVAAVAVDPPGPVSEAGGPPRLVTVHIGRPEAMPPLRGSDVIDAIHRRWADLGATQRLGTAKPVDAARSLCDRVARKVLGARSNRGGTASERELLAALVQAVDGACARIDELATRLDHLQAALAEVVDVVSEDVVRIRAGLQSVTGPPPASRA